MKPLTVPNCMYTAYAKYIVASIRYAAYAMHNTEYGVCPIKYTIHTTTYIVHKGPTL